MLKITELHRTRDEITLKLEGSITDKLLGEVKTAFDDALSGEYRLRLDMGDVAFIERRAVTLFHSLNNRHIEMFNCTPFILEQIKTGGHYADSSNGNNN